MSPPIEDSIRCFGHNRWLLGSSMICEPISAVLHDPIATWKSDDGLVLALRQLRPEELVPADREPGDAAGQRIHRGGTSSAVWKFGKAFCKVKAWTKGMGKEQDTIRYVEQRTAIPVPMVIYGWVDTKLNRTYLLLEEMNGRTLQHAWPSLSHDQHQTIANTIAGFCCILACFTSNRFESVAGTGVVEAFLTADAPASEPSWRPNLIGPFSRSDLYAYLLTTSIHSFPDLEDCFRLSHADLGPGNIMVSSDGEVSGILDWESAGYYPAFWLATKPLVSAGFLLSGPDRTEKHAWSALLTGALIARGFKPRREVYSKWRKAIGKS